MGYSTSGSVLARRTSQFTSSQWGHQVSKRVCCVLQRHAVAAKARGCHHFHSASHCQSNMQQGVPVSSSAHQASTRTVHPTTRRSLACDSAANGAATRANSATSAAFRWEAPPIVVVGAGIAGLATALALHRVGIPVVALEADGDGAREGSGAAIGLWENAWCALDALGVSQELRQSFIPLNRIELVTAQGRLLRSFGFEETTAGARPGRRRAGGGVAGSEFRGVRRAALLRALEAALPVGTVRAGARVVSISTAGSGNGSGSANAGMDGNGSRSGMGQWPSVTLEDGSVVEGAVVVGADGARSVVAGPRGLGLPQPSYAGYSAYRGVATLPGGLLSLGLPKDTIRQVWGKGVRAGLYPMNDREVYWFTCFNTPPDAPIPRTPTAMQAEVLSQVQGWAWGLEAAVKATPADKISRSRIVDRWIAGAYGRGLVTLCGDAAHPMTPNLGQGGCAALEDAVVLAQRLAAAAATPATPATTSNPTTAAASQPPLRASTQTNTSSSSSTTATITRASPSTQFAVSTTPQPAVLEAAIRQFERDRSARCLPLTVQANVMGALLQIPLEPVLAVRDLFISTLFSPSHFLDHTTYDCGTLTPLGLGARGKSDAAK